MHAFLVSTVFQLIMQSILVIILPKEENKIQISFRLY